MLLFFRNFQLKLSPSVGIFGRDHQVYSDGKGFHSVDTSFIYQGQVKGECRSHVVRSECLCLLTFNTLVYLAVYSRLFSSCQISLSLSPSLCLCLSVCLSVSLSGTVFNLILPQGRWKLNSTIRGCFSSPHHTTTTTKN